MLKQSTSIWLHAYWGKLKGERLSPARHEIEPARLTPVLPHIFIAEYLPYTQEYRFRLAGTKICEIYNQELAFKPLTFAWDRPEDQEQVANFMRVVRTRIVPGYLEFDGFTQQGFKASFEMLVLPLKNDHEGITRFIGTVGATKPAKWLGRLAIRSQTLRGTGFIENKNRRPGLATREMTDFPLLTAQGRLVRHKNRVFRIIEGGKSEMR